MTQAQDPKFPQSADGSLYPKNYVVGVIDDLSEAKQAIEAFKEAGYSAEEIRLMKSEEAQQKPAELDRDKNVFQRFFSSFQGKTDETGIDVYQQEASKGKHILHVRADSDDEVDKITALMQRYHGHAIKFFGQWSVADMPPRDTSQR